MNKKMKNGVPNFKVVFEAKTISGSAGWRISTKQFNKLMDTIDGILGEPMIASVTKTTKKEK